MADWESAVLADNSHKYADEDVDSDLGDWDVSSEDEEEIKKKQEEEKEKKEDDKLTKDAKRKKAMLQEREAKEAALREKRACEMAQILKENPELKNQEKALRQKMVEKADNELAADVFGDISDSEDEEEAKTKAPGMVKLKESEDGFSNAQLAAEEIVKLKLAAGCKISEYDLSTPEDWKTFGEEISKRVIAEEDPKQLILFLQDIIKRTTSNMKLDHLNKVKTTVQVIHTELRKKEQGKKKKGGKKKTLNSGRRGAEAYDYSNAYEDFGDY